jgi:hypothetical protein
VKKLISAFFIVALSTPAFAKVAVNAEKYSCATLQQQVTKSGELDIWVRDVFGYYAVKYYASPAGCEDADDARLGSVASKDNRNCFVGWYCAWDVSIPTGF